MPFPDYSEAKPDKTIREYRIDMHIDYEAGDHPILFSVSSAGKELRPRQAYAGYPWTGSFVLYGTCVLSMFIRGTRKSIPMSDFLEDPRRV